MGSSMLFDRSETNGNILCPDQPPENYCDCDGDCTERPEWCQCEDAQKCCNDASSSSTTATSIPMDDLMNDRMYDLSFDRSETYGSVLCPGQPSENYCDCDGDCTELPEWCQCEDAQECCGNSSSRSSPSVPSMEFLFPFGESDDGHVVLCPGQPSENYCDCAGDCTGNPSFCACSEAQECCIGAPPVVLCPDQPEENYCDCSGDCTQEPQWCECADAQKCCKEHSVHKAHSNVVAAMSVTGFASILVVVLVFLSKQAKGRESSLSEAAVKQDDDVTVASTGSCEM